MDVGPRLQIFSVYPANASFHVTPDRQVAEIQICIAIMTRCSALGMAETKAVA